MDVIKLFFGDNVPGGLNASRRDDRDIDELIGICRGVLADGAVNTSEAEFLKHWIERHKSVAKTYPYDALYRRLADAMEDGVLDADEERDLLDVLVRVVGGEYHNASREECSLSSSLPLDDPAPEIVYPSRTFVVTGTFAFGARAKVVSVMTERGALLAQAPSKKTHYVVVGEIGSRDWIHSSYGRKIETAVELRKQGVPLAIIAESHWRASLPQL